MANQIMRLDHQTFLTRAAFYEWARIHKFPVLRFGNWPTSKYKMLRGSKRDALSAKKLWQDGHVSAQSGCGDYILVRKSDIPSFLKYGCRLFNEHITPA